jgi:hypothetical protein
MLLERFQQLEDAGELPPGLGALRAQTSFEPSVPSSDDLEE